MAPSALYRNPPAAGTRWRLRNGAIVEIICVTNRHRTHDASYPTTVVYRLPTGEAESRSLASFANTARVMEPCRAIRLLDEMHCPACRKRWSADEEHICVHSEEKRT